MEKSYFLSNTFNEVIFRDRNKGYGAYQLRQVYDRNVKYGIIYATIVFAGALFTPLIKARYFPPVTKQIEPKIKDLGGITVIEILPEIEKPKVEQQAVAAPKEKIRTEAYTEPKVVPDNANVPEKVLADQEKLKGAAFGNEQIEGIEAPLPNISTSEAPVGIEDDGKSEDNNTGVFIHVEEMPAFPGGEEAMMKFIGNKIKYPGAAQRENIQGLVVVTFVVAPNGEIKDTQVLKGLGFGTEEEALRVVKMMPKWRPGKQNGKAVSVRYTLPIRFSMK